MNNIDTQILKILGEAPALFVSEVVARTGLPEKEVDAAVSRMASYSIIVVSHGSPDPHFSGDFRIVAAATSNDRTTALQAAESHWKKFLQTILSSHRCV